MVKSISVITVLLIMPFDVAVSAKLEAIRVADVVVRGEVTTVRVEVVKREEFYREDVFSPSTMEYFRKNLPPDKAEHYPMTFVTLRVDEVLRGPVDSELEFAVPGDGVRGANSACTYDYRAGQKMVVGLTFWPNLRGGTFVLRADNYRIDASGDSWSEKHSGTGVSLEEAREVVARGNLPSLTERSVFIGVGTVAELVPFEALDGAVLKKATWEVEHVLKGRTSTRQLDVIVLEAGGYDLDWHAWTQPLAVGQRYLLYLQETQLGLTPLEGTNGVYLLNDGEAKRAMGYAVPGGRIAR